MPDLHCFRGTNSICFLLQGSYTFCDIFGENGGILPLSEFIEEFAPAVFSQLAIGVARK